MGNEVTISDDIFALGEDATRPDRQAVSRGVLLARVSALMQSCEGCENVGVIGVTRLDGPDATGCNWSFSVVLDTAGVPAEVYGLAYAQVIAMARSSWNLE